MHAYILNFLVGIVALILICALIKEKYAKKYPANNTLTNILTLEHYSQYIYLTAAIVFVWVVRLPIFSLFYIQGNPDESAFIAKAMRIRHGWFNWDTLDPITSGPFNSIIIAWPYLLGLEPTIINVRITATFIISLMCIFIFFTLRRIGGIVPAVLCTLPLFVFYGATKNSDFIHYSSEHLSILLLSIAMYCFIRTLDLYYKADLSLKTFFMGAIILGMVPFAKLQAVPIAAGIGMMLFFHALWLPKTSTHYWLRIFLIMVGALASPLFFLLPLIIIGEFHHFFTSYIMAAMVYITSALSFSEFIDLAKSNYLFWITFFTFAGIIFYSTFASFIFRSHITAAQLGAFFTLSIALLLSYYCVISTGRPFLHYLHFILPFIALAAGGILGVLIAVTQKFYFSLINHVMIFIAIVLGVVTIATREIVSYSATKTPVDNQLIFHSPGLLQYLRPNTTDFLLAWGTATEYFSYTGITPATREPHLERQIALPALIRHYHDYLKNLNAAQQIIDSKLPQYYRERLMSDLSLSNPNFIIDSALSTTPWYPDQTMDTVFSLSPLSELIKRDYVEISKGHPDGDCPRLYLKRVYAEKLDLTKIEIENIIASGQFDDKTLPNNIDDNSVWEKCVDWWALPEGELGFIELHFSKIDHVAQVEILNTHTAPTDSIKISALLNGQVVHQQKINLNQYPLWTIYQFPQTVEADKVRIDILEFSHKSAGLNEVKIFRTAQPTLNKLYQAVIPTHDTE